MSIPMLHPKTETLGAATTLGSQCALWLSEIVAETIIQATWLQGSNAASVRFRKPDALTEWLRPANVGFGFSYALPIVVAALTAEPGKPFIVENPEAHLHPAGQSKMGRSLARLAGTGVECVVETHSDPRTNGVRLGVARDGVLSAADARITSLEQRGTRRSPSVRTAGLTCGRKAFSTKTGIPI